jgi:hypothetical protein
MAIIRRSYSHGVPTLLKGVYNIHVDLSYFAVKVLEFGSIDVYKSCKPSDVYALILEYLSSVVPVSEREITNTWLIDFEGVVTGSIIGSIHVEIVRVLGVRKTPPFFGIVLY